MHNKPSTPRACFSCRSPDDSCDCVFCDGCERWTRDNGAALVGCACHQVTCESCGASESVRTIGRECSRCKSRLVGLSDKQAELFREMVDAHGFELAEKHLVAALASEPTELERSRVWRSKRDRGGA